ncbi:MAG: response regulator transcription factor [Flavobacteriales bacterium]|nr:response regulator transcription factor [Flavobacteriales bacterium]MBP9079383.1 response regulator transcription factor [Flavobacteriales bacterium]
MNLRVAIIEDEPAAVRRMHKLLVEIDPGMEVVADLPSVEQAVAWFRQHAPPDLAFFDVRLADGSSFEVFNAVEVACPVIFVTAFDEFALKAFRVNALDYLLKPVKREELAVALQRVRELRIVRGLGGLARHEDIAAERPSVPVKRFLIRIGDRIRVVEPKDIAYFHSRQKDTYLRTLEGKDLPLDESLDRLEHQLPADRFFRLNRQLIVNFRSILELLAYSKSRVKVVLQPPFDEDALVSSERSAEFKRWLAG